VTAARSYDAVVIGGGSAGMAAALAIRAQGLSAAIVEREPFLGGILMQCIHSGFGVHEFRQDLTGPEYAERFIDRVLAAGIDSYLDTTVMQIIPRDGRREVLACSKRYGVMRLSAGAVVLAMGCRERNRGNIAIAGTRPSGVFTAGLAQRLVNIEGCIPGRRVVIIGSGDIGLIMARRLTLVGCKVLAVVEIQPYPSGLVRNIVQCLNDFSIPLYLGHVVARISGRDRVESVEVAPLADGGPDMTRAFRLDCDTVLLSVGLIPENELSRAAGVPINGDTGGPVVDADLMTGVEGIFACGNVLHVHDLVDFVSEESRRCGECVAAFLRGRAEGRAVAAAAAPALKARAGANVRYVVPGAWQPGRENVLFFRPMVVKNDALMEVTVDGAVVRRKRLQHVQPSEMIRLPLRPDELPKPDPARPNVMEVSIR
jgi:NADPH-dependent 2,4-dienoyl-CoA reductase/sulfur reductase-like enzyme